jgi:uncharacterized protein HemY
MDSKRDRARDLADEGLDKMVEGDKQKGRRLIDEAKKVDPRGVEDLAEEVERDKEKAERYVDKK